MCKLAFGVVVLYISDDVRVDRSPVVEVAEREVAVMALLLAKSDEVRLLQLKLRVEMKRLDVMHLEIVSATTRLTPGL
jgi:hypothetical protein